MTTASPGSTDVGSGNEYKAPKPNDPEESKTRTPQPTDQGCFPPELCRGSTSASDAENKLQTNSNSKNSNSDSVVLLFRVSSEIFLSISNISKISGVVFPDIEVSKFVAFIPLFS